MRKNQPISKDTKQEKDAKQTGDAKGEKNKTTNEEKVTNKADKSIKDDTSKKDEKKNSENPIQKTSVKLFPYVCAILLIIYECASFILFLFVSYYKKKSNMMYSSDPELSTPNSVIIVFHFIFHLVVILLIIALLVEAHKNSADKYSLVHLISIIASFFTLIFWAAYFGIYIVSTKENQKEITFDELNKFLNLSVPIDFAFIYSKDQLKIRDCKPNPLTGVPLCSNTYSKCYSRTGIKFPIKSNFIGERYNFLNVSENFYFRFQQSLETSNEYQLQLNETLKKIKHCSNHNLRIKYFPYVNTTYYVPGKEKPFLLTRKMRLAAGYLGAGADYELYLKSIPSYNFIQRISVDLDPDFDYSKLWTKKSCSTFGKCNEKNLKPFPDDDL